MNPFFNIAPLIPWRVRGTSAIDRPLSVALIAVKSPLISGAWRIKNLHNRIQKSRTEIIGESRETRGKLLAPRKTLRWLIFIFWMLALEACGGTPDTSLIDRSFLTHEPCAPPCWYGLEPDKSTKDDVYATLAKLPFVDQSSIGEWGTPWMDDKDAREIYFGCIQPSAKNCGAAQISKSKLKSIWALVGYELFLERVVQELGPPEYVVYSLYHPVSGGSNVDLVWAKKEIMLRSIDVKDESLFRALYNGKKIPGWTKVTAIFYVAPEGFTGRIGDCCTRIPWPGFEP